MRKEIIKYFVGKKVRLQRFAPGDVRPFNLYGVILSIGEDAVVFRTDRIGAIPIDQIVGIEEVGGA